MEDDLNEKIRRKRLMIEKLKKENEDIEKKLKKKQKKKLRNKKITR